MDYETLTDLDKLSIARDALRSREAEHFTLSLTNPPGGETRKAKLVNEMETLRTTISQLETTVVDDQPVEKKPELPEPLANHEETPPMTEQQAEMPAKIEKKDKAEDESSKAPK